MRPARSHRGLVLAIILVGYLLVLLDVSILMAALPAIQPCSPWRCSSRSSLVLA
jgi:hypothetical protein